MGNCLSNTVTYISNEFEKNIWGPHILEIDPIEFYSTDSLWNIDFKYFANEIIDNNCSLSANVLLIIFEFISIDIQQTLKCPNQWIIKTAMNRMQSLQPYYKNNKHISTKNTDKKPLRKSWSLPNDEIIDNNLIQRIIIGNIIPFEISQQYYYNHLFHEIIVYEPGGYFNKHCDTITQDYNYTLLLIPPSNYIGGQLIIKNKIVESNNNNWQWIVFHKHIKHKCEEILNGHKIVFKIHLSLRKMTKIQMDWKVAEDELDMLQNEMEFGWDDIDGGDVGFGPMVTGFDVARQQNAVVDDQVELYQGRQEYGQIGPKYG
eukprot:444079_1